LLDKIVESSFGKLNENLEGLSEKRKEGGACGGGK
jgi:hypothetical protein